MTKTIQIRNVPVAVHKKLKIRAAQEGKSLSEYLLAEVEQIASLPTLEEMAQRLAAREPVKLGMSAAAAVRKERDSA
jgi:plasmid stability protein